MNRKRVLASFLGASMLIFGVLILFMNINLNHPFTQVSSCSNYPVLEPGNVVVVEDTTFGDIEEGETVIYKESSNNMVVAHQVISKSENSLQTQGENNPRQLEFEKNVENSQVWGTKGLVIPINSGSKCSAK